MLQTSNISNLLQKFRQGFCFAFILMCFSITCAGNALSQDSFQQKADKAYSTRAKELQQDIEAFGEYGSSKHEGGRFGSGYYIKNMGAKPISKKLDNALKNNQITPEEYQELRELAKHASDKAFNESIQLAEERGKKGLVKRLKNKKEYVATEVFQGCATSEQLKAKYYSMCWSCKVFNFLLSAFLNAAEHGLNVTQRAGTLLLIVGSGLWLLFWGLKNVSSFTELQLPNILNELVRFLFKVMLAYWLIAYGATAIGKYFVSPIMSLGAIPAKSFISYGVNGEHSKAASAAVMKSEEYKGSERILSGNEMNALLDALRVITYNTSSEMIIGNMIMCYSTQEKGGKWNFLGVPNIFMWLEGAVVWCCGFMLTLAVGYYFLDISLKVGFAVLAFPIAVGLWPFNITKDKISLVLSIITKAAASFAFMAITTWFGIELLFASLGGADSLYANFDAITMGTGNAEAIKEDIANRLHFFSSSMLLILFAIIYFYKIVGKTTMDFVNKFFPDSAFGDSSPMHSAATMMTSMALKPVKGAASLAGDVASHQAGKALMAAGSKAAHPIKTAKEIKGMAQQGAQKIGNAAASIKNKLTGGNR